MSFWSGTNGAQSEFRLMWLKMPESTDDYYLLTGNGVLRGGSGKTIRRNTQYNPPPSNKAQYAQTNQSIKTT
jgi:hypothetical protein